MKDHLGHETILVDGRGFLSLVPQSNSMQCQQHKYSSIFWIALMFARPEEFHCLASFMFCIAKRLRSTVNILSCKCDFRIKHFLWYLDTSGRFWDRCSLKLDCVFCWQEKSRTPDIEFKEALASLGFTFSDSLDNRMNVS